MRVSLLFILLLISGCQAITQGTATSPFEDGVVVINNTDCQIVVFGNGLSQERTLLPGEHTTIPVKIIFETRTFRLDLFAKIYKDGKYVGVATQILWIEHHYNHQAMHYSNNLPQNWVVDPSRINYISR